ncbi:MAG: DUF1491 family protein [Pseudomonadota bacterium]
MPRITSELFVGALIRRVADAGGSAVVARRGSAEAGAVYITVWKPEAGTYRLYEPQSSFEDGLELIGGRLFRLHPASFFQLELNDKLDAESRFDPDFWQVDIENLTLDIDELISVASGDG